MSTYLPKDILAGLAEAKTATLRKSPVCGSSLTEICIQFCVCGNVGLQWMQMRTRAAWVRRRL